MNKTKNKNCTFCGQELSGENFFLGKDENKLCFNCIYHSKEFLDKQIKLKTKKYNLESLKKNKKTPQTIYQQLNQFIIGQDKAKKSLAVAVYNHYNRLINNLMEGELEIEKSNVLLIGPSGSGKTILARILANIIDLPFVITDATTLTEAGYVGDDVENILLRLIEKAEHNIELAEKGIIFIDEIDKISRKSESASITRDVSGEGVQQALLKIIEGTISSVPARGGRKHPQSQNIKINTKDILFICGGAFVGIDKIVENRLNQTKMGFKNEKKKSHQTDAFQLSQSVNQGDLIKFGLIPELVGRLPIITSLNKLTNQELKEIISKPKNSLLNQFKRLLAYDDIKIEIEKTTINFLIEESKKIELGARGLKSVFERIIQEVIFIAPNHKGKTLYLTIDNIKKKTYFKKS